MAQDHTPTTSATGERRRVGVEDEVRRLAAEPGGALLVQGSASIVQALARADLVDGYL